MDEYFFGLHRGHLTAEADRIARRHGAWHVNCIESDGRRRGWFSCPNRGAPFDRATAKAVMADIERAGGIEALLHRRDRRRQVVACW
jgi:hypothetical protein